MGYTHGWLDGNKRYHVVAGDCLWNIALDYMGAGNRYPEIKQANGLSSNVIYPNQVFIIPGVTPGYGGAPAPAPPVTPEDQKAPNIVWFALESGTQRKMNVIWQQAHNKFKVRWEIWDSNGHLWQEAEETPSFTDQQKAAEHTFQESNDRFKCRVSIRAINDDGSDKSPWAYKEYDFRENPPELPPSPNVDIDRNDTLTVTFENIPENKGIEAIEVALYQDNTTKYDTFIINVNNETRHASHQSKVEPGHYYNLRARSIKYTLPGGKTNPDGIRGGWTDYTNNIQSSPIAPTEILVLAAKKIVEQSSTTYGVNIEWDSVVAAKTYTVQWTTDPEFFDTAPDKVNSQTTKEGSGPKLLITNIELGHEYYFRVGSNNDKGSSLNWTPIRSIKLGSRPSAPTTWSNTTSNIVGEDLNLYWTHNATDGSRETYARLNLILIDSAHPSAKPMEITKVIENTRSEDDPSSISSFTINASDPEFALLTAGFTIKWKVQTAGVGSEYSEWSTEREVNVYARPELELDIKNKYDESITDIFEFPFYISLLAKPSTQTPISYYIEVISNNTYETVDEVGNVKTVNAGDAVYQKFVDPESNAWRLLAYMTPGDIDLQSGFSYTVKATVSMNSGLLATAEQSFSTDFTTSTYDIFADITINKETLEASIKPYAKEWYYEDDTPHTRDAVNCVLAVYRREYDGSFTEIATDIANGENIHVTDPHPSLDYARYRVVVRSEDNGSISFRDIEAVKVGEPSVVIQWAEQWSRFETENSEEPIEPAWAGSMIRIPYNIDTSESNNKDVSLIEYVGRKHPVSYYGTQLGEISNWKVDIPADDKETLYNIRRLARWTGDVYVREPSGVGYWANISVSYSTTHKSVIIPISFSIKRVEGGI